MAKALIEPRTLKGFRDFLPSVMIQKEAMINTIKEVFKLYGFVPIDTPTLEYAEILTGKGGDETDKQMYRFKDSGDRDVAMRFDLTVPFARYTAQHYNELIFPFKRYHIANVWRGENTQAGRYREFMQCDFDTIGTTSIINDVETISVIYDCMKALGINNFTIRINNRILLNGLLKYLSVEDKQLEILRTIDKLSKIGKDNVYNILLNEVKLNKDQINKILFFISIKGTYEESIKEIKSNFKGEKLIDDGVNTIEQIINSLTSVGISEKYCKLDLSITRGLDYYTGMVVETFLDDMPNFGSICSGGRYDNLAGLYTNQILPGVGASIGLDRLLAALGELKLLESKACDTDVLILNLDNELGSYYLTLARDLRKNNIKVEVYPEAKKLQKQFTFADNKGFKVALIIGKEEKENNSANIRIVSTGERIDNVNINDIFNKIKEIIKKE